MPAALWPHQIKMAAVETRRPFLWLFDFMVFFKVKIFLTQINADLRRFSAVNLRSSA